MYNRVIMAGHLTRDIELKHIPSGTAVANSSIATNYKYGESEEICFLEFTAFGKPAEILSQYTRKGSKVLLEGRLVLETWEDKNTGAKRSRHTLRVENFKFLDSKSDGSSSYQGGNNSNSYNSPSAPSNNYTNSSSASAPKKEELPSIDIDNDEIPF